MYCWLGDKKAFRIDWVVRSEDMKVFAVVLYQIREFPEFRVTMTVDLDRVYRDYDGDIDCMSWSPKGSIGCSGTPCISYGLYTKTDNEPLRLLRQAVLVTLMSYYDDENIVNDRLFKKNKSNRNSRF